METTALSRLLKSLCNESYWKYAVFWKLHHQSPMLLTWEDGYYDCSELNKPAGNMPGDICFGTTTNMMLYPQIGVQKECSSGCPISLALADMSYFQYPLGEGLVGEVAYSGNHCWCYSDSQLVSECPKEWRLRFLGGIIKTILLVPVSPHGVLQLGSFEKVSKDLVLVEFVKERFMALQNELSAPFPLTGNVVGQPSSLLLPGCTENLDDLSGSTSNLSRKPEYKDLKVVERVNGLENQFSTRSQVRPKVTVKDALLAFEKNIPDILDVENESVMDASSVDVMTALSPKREELSDEITDMIEQLLEDNDCIDIEPTATTSFSTLPTEIAQHKVLAPDFNRWTGDCMWGSSLTGTGASSSAGPIFSSHLTDPIEVSAWESSEWFFKGDDGNHFESIFAGTFDGVDDTTLSENSNFIRSFETTLEPLFSPTEARNQFEQNAMFEYNSIPWDNTMTFTQYNSIPWNNNMTFASQSSSNGRDKVANSSPIASSFKNARSRLADHHLPSNGYGSITVQPRKGAKVSKVGKRRSGHGENQRQRPRDRQMIQDRVKELRELVPNGEKCSIDGLLERTIKHMLFLRSVSNRAEKFKEWSYHEVAGSRNSKSSETKSVGQIGTSRAFQLGNELEVCPIVVEDLEYPGHILIEMLCSEHGLFLEIAQVIRGLGLTILDGKIENRSDESTWARFIVEVLSGFHRMDIFWPLMHLYRRNQSSISSKI